MNAYAGITYIELGGKERPLKFGTNQTATLCELRGVDLEGYPALLSRLDKDLGLIRDFLYSALRAGARSEKMAIDFDNETIGDWLDEARENGTFEEVMQKMTGSLASLAPPNENRAQRRAKEKTGQ